MRSVSVQIRLRGAKRGDDEALGEEMQRLETTNRRNGETASRRYHSPIRRFDALWNNSRRDIRGSPTCIGAGDCGACFRWFRHWRGQGGPAVSGKKWG